MKLSESMKTVDDLAANAVNIVNEVNEARKTIIITESGQPKAVIQDIATYEKLQESLALLKILAMGEKSRAAGRTKPMNQVFDNLRLKLAGNE